MSPQRFPCPCCKNLTLDEAPPGTFAVCPVCNWEDDEVQFRDPTFAGGANRPSLEQARANYRSFGAIEKEIAGIVRPPTAEEKPSG